MTERSYGYKYDEMGGKYLSGADIAKRIRADIKAAVSDGLLPGAPVVYRVKTHNYSGARSIDVTVTGWPGAWRDCDGWVFNSRDGRREYCRNVWCKAAGQYKDQPGADVHQVLTEEANAALITLDRIHGAYNHDGSDSMTDHFDVNYYGQVSFQSAQSAAWQAEHQAEKVSRRKQTDTTAAAGEAKRVIVYGSKGKRTVHDAVDVDGRTRLVCGATLWRSSVLGDGSGRDLTCTRCAKRAAKTAPADRRELFRYEIARRDTLKRSYVRISLPPGDDRTGQAIVALFPHAWMFRLEGSASWEKV